MLKLYEMEGLQNTGNMITETEHTSENSSGYKLMLRNVDW